MFRSGMTVAELFAVLRDDVDISLSIGDELLFVWLNAVQNMLYSELIREQRYTEVSGKGDAVLYTELSRGVDEAVPEARDIEAVFADGVEARRVSGGIGRILHGDRPSWYDGGNAVCMILPDNAELVQIAHIIRPADAELDSEVCVPREFIPMVLSRLRGEMYRIANEDGLASKWLSDYNTELETFKLWCAQHGKTYGM